MLAGSLEKYALAVEKCAVAPMVDEAFAAHVSLAYNIGTGAYCKSSAARLWSAGDVGGSCDAVLKWTAPAASSSRA
jgi:lysozyme